MEQNSASMDPPIDFDELERQLNEEFIAQMLKLLDIAPSRSATPHEDN